MFVVVRTPGVPLEKGLIPENDWNRKRVIPDDLVIDLNKPDAIENIRTHTVSSIWIKPQTIQTLLNINFWQNIHKFVNDRAGIVVEGFGIATQEVIRIVNKLFLLRRVEGNIYRFIKIDILHPQITSPEDINKAISQAIPLSNLFNTDIGKDVCDMVHNDPKVVLGRGAEGEVFRVESWYTNVVVKKIIGDKFYIDGSVTVFNDPVNGVYTSESGTIEVLASSVLNSIASGDNDAFFDIHLPRYEGYFICKEPEGHIEYYLISELLDGPNFMTYLKQITNIPDKTQLKVAIWQVLYSIICMNRAGWVHQDCSTKNVLTKASRNAYYRGQKISDFQDLQYEIDNVTYTMPVTDFLPVITDFGFTVKSSKVELSDIGEFGSTYKVSNAFRSGFDISYFIITLLGMEFANPAYDIKVYIPLFEDWLKIAGITMNDVGVHVADYRSKLIGRAKGFPQNPFHKVFIYSTLRPREVLFDWNTAELLNSRFFEGIIERR
jgi:serine/threonine protein kinase